MKILFAIAVSSFAALVWAALAIVRHVRKNSARAAAKPASDAELSEAIGLRLNEMTQQSSQQSSERRVAAVSPDAEQDFSYFSRDAASSRPEKKPYPDLPPPNKPAIADPS